MSLRGVPGKLRAGRWEGADCRGLAACRRVLAAASSARHAGTPVQLHPEHGRGRPAKGWYGQCIENDRGLLFCYQKINFFLEDNIFLLTSRCADGQDQKGKTERRERRRKRGRAGSRKEGSLGMK